MKGKYLKENYLLGDTPKLGCVSQYIGLVSMEKSGLVSHNSLNRLA